MISQKVKSATFKSAKLFQTIPSLKVFNKVYPSHILHQYSNLTKKKSNVVTMPIIDAGEAKYQDCVQILRTYENQMYGKAWLVSDKDVPNIENTEFPPILDNYLLKLSFQ